MTPLILIAAAGAGVTLTRLAIAAARGYTAGHALAPVQQPARLAYRIGRWVRERRDQVVRDRLAAHRQEHR